MFDFFFQVNDFLSGAAPLNLTMRLGDHMMLIQLQLSTVNQASSSSSRRKSTIQISSSSPPPYPTPPPSAPSSPTFDPTASSTPAPSSSSSSSSKKVRVPLLSPGGLYTAPTPAPARASSHSSHSQTIHRNLNPSQQPEQTQSRKSLSGSRAASSESGEPPAKKAKLDTKALAEASKNLTQTLKQLSSEVLTTRTDQEPAAASSSSSSAASSSTSSSSSSSSQIPKKQVNIRHTLSYKLDVIIFIIARNRPAARAALAAALTVAAAERRGDTAESVTAAEEPSLSPCIIMARESTREHSQVRFIQIYYGHLSLIDIFQEH